MWPPLGTRADEAEGTAAAQEQRRPFTGSEMEDSRAQTVGSGLSPPLTRRIDVPCWRLTSPAREMEKENADVSQESRPGNPAASSGHQAA